MIIVKEGSDKVRNYVGRMRFASSVTPGFLGFFGSQIENPAEEILDLIEGIDGVISVDIVTPYEIQIKKAQTFTWKEVEAQLLPILKQMNLSTDSSTRVKREPPPKYDVYTVGTEDPSEYSRKKRGE